MTDSGLPDGLSFDRAAPHPDAPAATLQCANCQRPITDTYHTVRGAAHGAMFCSACRALIESATQPITDSAVIVKSVAFGVGAATVGGVLYWGVMRFANLEIGIVAVLTGWLVGRAMQAGSGGKGGRVLQVIAALLVYLSVCAAYLAFAEPGPLSLSVIAFGLALPVLVVIRSLPGGLLSALIIGFGVVQAWRMMSVPAITFEGPFRLGDSRPAA